jgi:hypothetical protein
MSGDFDHLRLHASGVSHAGIIIAAPDASIGAIIGGAMLFAEALGVARDITDNIQRKQALEHLAHNWLRCHQTISTSLGLPRYLCLRLDRERNWSMRNWSMTFEPCFR